MRCVRCNKQIWVPDSVRHGMGPVCQQHVFEDLAWRLLQAALRKCGKAWYNGSATTRGERSWH